MFLLVLLLAPAWAMGEPIAVPDGADVEAFSLAFQDDGLGHTSPPPATLPAELPDETCTDLGNARRLVRLHGDDMRYAAGLGQLAWDGKRWARDETGQWDRFAQDAAKNILTTAALVKDPDLFKKLLAWASKSLNARPLENMQRLAQTQTEIVARVSDFDQHPLLLNVENGTLDLETGKLRPHRRRDLLTRIAPTPYISTAKAPTWERFVDEIMGRDAELVRYLQKAVGYACSGLTREQCLFVFWGSGANGKTTFIEVVRRVLGEYAVQSDSSALLVQRSGGPRNDIARLAGARFVAATETAEGQKLDAAMVKQLTGGDVVTTRFLYQESFEFYPEFKLFLSTNHKPRVRGDDDAIWRRMRLVPFTVTIPEDRRDKALQEKLMRDRHGILRWAVDGCRAWLEEGLATPSAVRAATEEYRKESDALGAFLDDRCRRESHLNVSATDLFQGYRKWAEEHSEFPLSQRVFGQRLTERGFERYRGGANGETKYRGLELCL
jgi:putative DNA primase/helicase